MEAATEEPPELVALVTELVVVLGVVVAIAVVVFAVVAFVLVLASTAVEGFEVLALELVETCVEAVDATVEEAFGLVAGGPELVLDVVLLERLPFTLLVPLEPGSVVVDTVLELVVLLLVGVVLLLPFLFTLAALRIRKCNLLIDCSNLFE